MIRRLLPILLALMVVSTVNASLSLEEKQRILERASILEQAADTLSKQQKFREALSSLQAAKRDYEAIGDRERTFGVTDRIALHHFFMADYDKALEAAIATVRIAEVIGDKVLLARAHYMVGYIYRDVKEHDIALRYFQDSERFAREGGDQHHRAMALNEIGNIFMVRNDLDKAAAYKQQAVKIAKETADTYVLSACLHDLGLVYLDRKDYAAALRHFEQALTLDRESKHHREMIIALMSIGAIRQVQGHHKLAIAPLSEALEHAETLGLKSEIGNLLQRLAESYTALGLHDKAFSALQRAYTIREQIFSDEKARNIIELQTRFETEQKNRENEILKRDNRIKDLELARQHTQRNLLLLVASMALILVFVLYNRYRVKSRANSELAAANRAISAQKLELDEANKRLDILARTDSLTDLPNRREMTDRISTEIRGSYGAFRPFVLILGDIDNFKTINDRFGHHVGDVVLRKLAERLKESLRAYDSVARWGGEEFLLLLPGTDLEQGTSVAQRIHNEISSMSIEAEGFPLHLSMTFGVVACTEPGPGMDEYLKAADRALYRGKNQGKNRVVAFPSPNTPPLDLPYTQTG